jgi:uncharacterized protein (DUF1778 family)
MRIPSENKTRTTRRPRPGCPAVQVRMSRAGRKLLELAAERRGVSLSELIRTAALRDAALTLLEEGNGDESHTG